MITGQGATPNQVTVVAAVPVRLTVSLKFKYPFSVAESGILPQSLELVQGHGAQGLDLAHQKF